MRQVTADRRRALYEEAAEIIRSDYAGRLDVDSVARRVATSRRQLQRVFAEFGGTSFRQYVAAVRMQRAEELLREGILPVGEVAQRVGYRQPAQFAKAFRRHRGTAPSELRALNGARPEQFEDAAAA